MKKIFFFLSVFFFINSKLYAQQANKLITPPANSFISLKNTNVVNPISEVHFLKTSYGPDKDQEFYQRRRKNYRIVGWSTLGAGIVLSGIGLLLANGDYASNNANSNTTGALTIIGATSGIVSIPFMVMANVYKHKARAMVQTQKTGFGVPPNISSFITGISVSIPLGN